MSRSGGTALYPSPMIYVDVSAAVHSKAGLGRYSERLAGALLARDPGRYALFYNRGDAGPFPESLPADAPRREVRWGYKPWRMAVLLGHYGRVPFNRLVPNAELFHSTEHLLLPLRDVPTVLTVHDLRFLHGYGGLVRGLYGRHLYGRVLRRAAVVVAVSEAVREELRAAYGAGLSPLVARNAPSLAVRAKDDVRVGEVLARLRVAGPYVLVVARDEPRKALRAAASAWGSALRASGVGLVVAGAAGFASDGVTSLGAVADDDLAALYAGARRTLVPSRYEGFSLPIVESLAASTPVLASDLPAHRELAAATGSGLVLVPAPRASDGPWPEGATALLATPAPVASPPSWTWDDAARVVAAAIRG